jgi:hypothetical protein
VHEATAAAVAPFIFIPACPLLCHVAQNGTCPKGVNCNMAHNLFGKLQQYNSRGAYVYVAIIAAPAPAR